MVGFGIANRSLLTLTCTKWSWLAPDAGGLAGHNRGANQEKTRIAFKCTSGVELLVSSTAAMMPMVHSREGGASHSWRRKHECEIKNP